jgi:hypothetical protein
MVKRTALRVADARQLGIGVKTLERARDRDKQSGQRCRMDVALSGERGRNFHPYGDFFHGFLYSHCAPAGDNLVQGTGEGL